jgi:hypothetical protein
MSTKNEPRSKAVSWTGTYTLVNGTVLNLTPLFTTKTWTNSVTYGPNIPGWRDKIRNGLSATTSLTGIRGDIQYKPGKYRVERDKAFFPSTQVYVIDSQGSMDINLGFPSDNLNTISTTEANNAALVRLNRQILRVNTALQGGVVLGELRQTLYGIRNPARGLRILASRWRDWAVVLRNRLARRRQLSELLKYLSESWLEYSFHWKPLLNDIDDGCRALAEINTGQALYSEAVRGIGVSESGVQQSTLGSQYGMLKFTERSTTVDHCQVVYRGAVRMNTRGTLGGIGELLGFQPSQFVPTAWELLPYSFLIDYFTNIGDILAGYSSLYANLSWCNRTVRRQRVVTRVKETNFGLYIPSDRIVSITGSAARVIATRSDVSRSEYTGTFFPTFELEIPGFRSLKWLNIAALVAGRTNDRTWRFGD